VDEYCTCDCGTVFELARNPKGEWTERILHNFAGYTSDGANPSASLTLDSAGNIYGTTSFGGSGGFVSPGQGTAFEITP
jgi:hypothetical protein